MANILIIDDEEQLLHLLKAVLERKSPQHDITLALSAEEALETFEAGKYDLMLVDLRLGGMNGLEFCLQVREFDKEVIILAITAFYDPIFTKYDGKMAGFNEVFEKPYDFSKLLNYLEENGFL